MWHPLTFVAESRFLNAEKLIEFSEKPENWAKYGLVSAGQGMEVSTWNVDALVRYFKASLDENEAREDRDIAIKTTQKSRAV
jgi:hypothetical protein